MATDAGSRMHVLDWVEPPRNEFLESLNKLLHPTSITVGPNDHWRPLGRHDPSELRLTRPDDPLVPVDLARHLRSWWLAIDHPGANDPNWDFTGDEGMAAQGEPLRDADHWRTTVLDHTRGILPEEFWEREVSVEGAPLWLLIRSLPCARQSAPAGQRPSLEIG